MLAAVGRGDVTRVRQLWKKSYTTDYQQRICEEAVKHNSVDVLRYSSEARVQTSNNHMPHHHGLRKPRLAHACV